MTKPLTRKQAQRLLTEKRVIAITKHYNYPAFLLEDGTQITFEVLDHGSGTYELEFRQIL